MCIRDSSCTTSFLTLSNLDILQLRLGKSISATINLFLFFFVIAQYSSLFRLSKLLNFKTILVHILFFVLISYCSVPQDGIQLSFLPLFILSIVRSGLFPCLLSETPKYLQDLTPFMFLSPYFD